jgi:hypothetical protein
VAAWRTPEHLEDHYWQHRHEFPGYSIEQYDASAQKTISIGIWFTFREPRTHERRAGYYHRDSARFTVTDTDGYIRSHFHTDEAHVADLPASGYQD